MKKVYETKIKTLPGTNYSEIYPSAWSLYKKIASRTKRRPYVRSAFFSREKIFLDYFWSHIRQKNLRDRTRRLRFYACAVDLICNSRIAPISSKETNKSSEIFHRFSGITKEKQEFHVHIKVDVSRNEKHFISVFPE